MGGSSKHVFDLIVEFMKIDSLQFKLITRGKENGLYSADEHDAQQIYENIKKNGNIIELNKSKIFNPLSYFRYLKEANYVILQHPVMGLMGGVLGKLLRKKIIYHYHGPIHEEYRLKTGKKGLYYNLLWLFQKITVLCSDKVLTHSDYMRDIAVKEHSLPIAKSIFLPPYIEAHEKSMHLKFLKNNNKTKLFIPRRLTARTGVVEFLNTFLSLDKSNRDRFDIYISGKGELKEKVEGLVKYDPDNLKYVGFLSYDELWSMYHKIDSVVVPTLDLEGFGYVILEALSCGANAIVSKTCGGGYEFAEKYLSKDNTFDVFSKESVLAALTMIEESRNSRDKNMVIANEFTIKRMIDKYVNIILK